MPLYGILNNFIQRAKSIDFSSLTQFRMNWNQQTTIPTERIKLFSACLIHFNGQIGDVIRYVGGNYTAAHRPVEQTL